MKLSKASWLILSTGVFVVVVAGLGLTRSQQIQQESQLGDELGLTQTRLTKFDIDQLRQQQADLQKQLDESAIQLTAAKDKLHQNIESIDVTDEFFRIARSRGVTVASISSSKISTEKLGDIVCSVIELSGTATGKVSNLINFVTGLNTDFTTGVVRSVQMSIPEATDQNEPSATVRLVIYTY